jgi:hypothetical protein
LISVLVTVYTGFGTSATVIEVSVEQLFKSTTILKHHLLAMAWTPQFEVPFEKPLCYLQNRYKVAFHPQDKQLFPHQHKSMVWSVLVAVNAGGSMMSILPFQYNLLFALHRYKLLMIN